MYFRRRTFIWLSLLATLVLLGLRLKASDRSIRSLLSIPGKGLDAGLDDDDLFIGPRPQAEPPPWKDVFPPGDDKPKDYKYTRAIVMARTKAEDATWVDNELSDVLMPKGLFEKFIYVADDRRAPLHPIKNKGHEVMIYLTYIIDHYDDLPDVSIFVHSDRFTWHNNPMMDDDLAGMIRYLRPEKVVRDGYVNLRCHDFPGCPDYLHLSPHAKLNDSKKEEQAISQKWAELFPVDPMPPVLSQPCCAQFAVSKERIRAIPRQRYIFLKAWITRTELDDYRSGRVFEYTWQYIFTGNPVLCPTMSKCYCESYGICFADDVDFATWEKLHDKKSKLAKRLRRLKDAYMPDDGTDTNPGGVFGRVSLEVRMMIGDLQRDVAKLDTQLKDMRDKAWIRGRDIKLPKHSKPV